MNFQHKMPFGTRIEPGGAASFRLWAPGARRVDLVLLNEVGIALDTSDTTLEMRLLPDGWHELERVNAAEKTRYAYRIDG
ncbi:MAG: hypothetical protein ABI564_17735, partial [Ideonella sp.]